MGLYIQLSIIITLFDRTLGTKLHTQIIFRIVVEGAVCSQSSLKFDKIFVEENFFLADVIKNSGLVFQLFILEKIYNFVYPTISSN
jgi:hypothetical protein